MLVTDAPRKRSRGGIVIATVVTCIAIIFLALVGWFMSWVRLQRLNFELQQATIAGDVPAIKRLVSSGADVNGTGGTPPLILAAMNYHPEAVKFLLEHRADVNIVNETDHQTALSYVVSGAQMRPVAAEATARVLLAHGADVKLAPTIQSSPYKWAEEVSATLKRNPQFYAFANHTYAPEQRPPGSETDKVPDKLMEASRRKLVDAILKAGGRIEE